MNARAMLAETSEATTSTLLGRLTDDDDVAWREIDNRYRRIIVAMSQKLGLSASDADDVAQDTLAEFLRAYRAGKYERERGKLRAWLMGIARYRITDCFRKRAGRRETRGASAIGMIPDEEQLSVLWDAQADQFIVAQAWAELQKTGRLNVNTLRAFELNVMEQRPPEDVAAILKIPASAVYIAKHRCMARLQKIMARLRSKYELD